MKPLVGWTFRQRRMSIVWWCVGIVFFVFLTLIFYPSIRDQSAELNKSFDQLPETAKQLFTDTNDLFSPVGYLSSQMFYLMMPMLLGILAISQGISLLGKEERDTTIELLLARPISRTKLLLGKALSGALIVLVVGALSISFTGLMCRLVGLEVQTVNVAQAGAAVLLLALSLGAVAFLFTAFGRTGRAAAIGVSAVFALGGYILVSLAPSVEWLKWPAKLFPFNYYHSAELLGGTYNWLNSFYLIAVIVGCLILSWLAFRKRDLLGS